MDDLILKIYLKDSYFYIEGENENTITIASQKPNHFSTEDKVDFWKNILPLLDGEPVTIELAKVTDIKMVGNAKIEKVEKLHLHCLLRLPKVFINKKISNYYVKSFIDITLLNDFMFENDNLNVVLDLLTRYGCVFGKERLFKDSLDKQTLTVNFCCYIPIAAINKLTLLK